MKRGYTLAEFLAVLVMIFLLAALTIPFMRPTSCGPSCARNLRSLYDVLHIYMTQHRGAWPEATGEAFWLRFQETKPPLIDPSACEVYFCQVEGEIGGPGATDYRGPVEPQKRYRQADPLGADKIGNHGEGHGGNVLRAAGDVQHVDRDDPLWALCRSKLDP